MASAFTDGRARASSAARRPRAAADAVAGPIAVAVIVACVGVLTATVAIGAMPAVKARLGWAPPVEPATYPTGVQVDVPAGVYQDAPFTVIAFVSPSCPACERSKPILSDLTSALRGSSVPVALIASVARLREYQRYAQEVGIAPAHVYPLDLSTLRAERVPITLVVRRDGLVMWQKEGALQASDRDALLVQSGALVTQRP